MIWQAANVGAECHDFPARTPDKNGLITSFSKENSEIAAWCAYVTVGFWFGIWIFTDHIGN
jgi:hypothetical protein